MSKAKQPKVAVTVEQRPRNLLLVIFFIALCLRCIYLWQISSAPFFDLRMGDGEAYHQWARRIANGDWIGQGVFYQAPLYPYFLALIFHYFSLLFVPFPATADCSGTGLFSVWAVASFCIALTRMAGSSGT